MLSTQHRLCYINRSAITTNFHCHVILAAPPSLCYSATEMSFAVFHLVACPACERQTDAPGHCPWCGERLLLAGSLRLRLAALAIAYLLLFFTTATYVTRTTAALAYSAGLSAIIFALASPDKHALLQATLAAGAGSALCHIFPENMALPGLALRSIAVWAIPLTSLAFIAGGGIRLPPAPANTIGKRLMQALLAPGFIIALCVMMALAASRPPAPASAIALALGGYIWLKGPQQHPATFPSLVFFHVWLNFAPYTQGNVRSSPHGMMVASLAAWGIVQSLIEIKQSRSVPSTQP